MSGFRVLVRRPVTKLTDRERRVYDGHPFSSETNWGPWCEVYVAKTAEDAADSVATYRRINPAREYKVEAV